MATLSVLVKAIAEVQGLDENQVLWIARYLREDGLISQGGRGRGGARMEVRDAVNLLLGVNAPGTAKQSTALVRTFRELRLSDDLAWFGDKTDDDWRSLQDDLDNDLVKSFYRATPFARSLETLLKCFFDGKQPDKMVRVGLSGPEFTASIYIGAEEVERAGDVMYHVRFSEPILGVQQQQYYPDQETSRYFTHRTLEKVAQLLLD